MPLRCNARAEHASAKPYQLRFKDVLALAPRYIVVKATPWHKQPLSIEAAVTANVRQLLMNIALSFDNLIRP